MRHKKCIRNMPAPVSGAYVIRCLLAVRLQYQNYAWIGELNDTIDISRKHSWISPRLYYLLILQQIIRYFTYNNRVKSVGNTIIPLQKSAVATNDSSPFAYSINLPNH